MTQALDLKLTVTAHLIKYPHFCAVRDAAISILMTPVHCMKEKKRENEMLAPVFLMLSISGALIFALVSSNILFCNVIHFSFLFQLSYIFCLLIIYVHCFALFLFLLYFL